MLPTAKVTMFEQYREAWCLDFEFDAQAGERPRPICLVARELRSDRELRLWEDDLLGMTEPPFPTGPDVLFVTFYGSAELGCFLALGWPMPANMVDLFVEFRTRTNGTETPAGSGLLGALVYFGLSNIGTAAKDAGRELVLRGGPWSTDDRRAVLDYCASDVDATTRLFDRMAPDLDMPRALLRGRYMSAVARMEATGVPVDVCTLTMLRDRWVDLKASLVERIDERYGIYEGVTFKQARFADYLAARQIPWPRTETGALKLDDGTFRTMARSYSELQPLRELRATMAQLRLEQLAVGTDGRNRCMLSPYRTTTGRNAPSNARSIFGPAVWIRSLVRPEPGTALAYVDWAQQEFGIAAALSGDQTMWEAYSTGDPYLAFAKQAGAVPVDATKQTHGAERERFKACVLATQYGMGPDSLAQRIGQPKAYAAELLRLHRETYRTFWRWSDGAVDHANLHLSLQTVFGWKMQLGQRIRRQAQLQNWPMQSNGAEMMRLACIDATEQGVRVCAPIHDALLIEAPTADIEATVAATQLSMRKASALVLGGRELRADAEIIRYPNRYQDSRGAQMWATVMGELQRLEGKAA